MVEDDSFLEVDDFFLDDPIFFATLQTVLVQHAFHPSSPPPSAVQSLLTLKCSPSRPRPIPVKPIGDRLSQQSSSAQSSEPPPLDVKIGRPPSIRETAQRKRRQLVERSPLSQMRRLASNVQSTCTARNDRRPGSMLSEGSFETMNGLHEQGLEVAAPGDKSASRVGSSNNLQEQEIGDRKPAKRSKRGPLPPPIKFIVQFPATIAQLDGIEPHIN